MLIRLVSSAAIFHCLAFASLAWAAPATVQQISDFSPNAPFRGASAVTYGPDGTLYVVESANFITPSNLTTVRVISPAGVEINSFVLTGADPSTIFTGDIAYNPATGNLLITDNAFGANALYEINPATGLQTSTFDFVNITSIANVAVRQSGQILVSSSNGFGAGAIHLIDPTAMSTTPVITGLEFAAGLAFDSAGNLVYQNTTTDFSTFVSMADIIRVEVTESGGALLFGASELLADDVLGGTFDLAIDANGDIFATGAGGLYQLDRDANGDFLGTLTLLDSQGPFAFAGGVTTGPNHSLAYIPDFAFGSVRQFSNVLVPEPAGWLVGVAVFLFVLGMRKRRRLVK